MQSTPFGSNHSAASHSKTLRSTLVSRNVTIAGHRTSVRLEPEMWTGISEICRREGASLHEVCTAVANRKGENTSLTAAIRVFVMSYYRTAATEEGHTRTGHGYGIATLIANMSGNRPTPTTGPASISLQSSIANPAAASPYGTRAYASSGTRNGFR
jgi:predicted DNA-binding ribbon-helix-helix protein